MARAITSDLRVLDDDAVAAVSSDLIFDDFEHFLADCERFLSAVVQNDYDSMRNALTEVIIDRDGRKNGDQERSLLAGDQDMIIMVSAA
jgi:hypothetical protein